MNAPPPLRARRAGVSPFAKVLSQLDPDECAAAAPGKTCGRGGGSCRFKENLLLKLPSRTLLRWGVLQSKTSAGVELVGFPRKGALLEISTWSNMHGGFSSLSPSVHRMVTSAWEVNLKTQFPVQRGKRNLQRKGLSSEKKELLRDRASRHHAELALLKYNTANNTKFELVEMKARNLFFEFGGGYYHYNFTDKPEDHHSSDGSMKLFFAEINYCPRSEKDVLLCCTVGENDAGHCYGCIGYQPVMVHPTSRAYGGGYTDVIDMPRSDGSSSDSDY